MANFDEFDAQSQALLTSLQQSNKFLSFQDLNKGYSSPIPQTSSKLASHQWKYLKRTSTEIQEIFFGFITPIKINNLTLTQEPNCECNIDPREFLVYKERGNTPGYQKEEDELLFKVKIFISTRGEIIQQSYFECGVDTNEVLLFIEDNTGDTSNAKMYAKFGSESQKAILLGLGATNSLFNFLKTIPGVTEDVINELITKGEYESESSIIKSITVGLFKFVSILAYPAKAIGWIVDKLGNTILNLLTLPDSVWDSRSEEYFLNRENVIKSLNIDTGILKTINSSLNDDPEKLQFTDIIPDFVLEYVKKGITIVEYLINNYNQFVTAQINRLYDEYEQTVEKADFYLQLSESVAYTCGIWNGIVDFVGGLLIFIGQVLQVQNNIGKDFEAFLEHFDSFIDSVKQFDFSEFWNGVTTQFGEIKKYLQNLKLTDINFDKVAYFTGFAIAFIATMFIPFTAFAKPINVLNKAKNIFPAGLVEKISQATVKTSDFAINATQKSASAFLKMFREIVTLLNKGAKAVADFVKDLWKKIADWFVDNKKIFKKIEVLTPEELDWMASRKIGNLGGKVLKSTQIRKLRGILKQKGILLIVEGDAKSITRKFIPIDNFKTFDELLLFMKTSNPQKVGMFHASTKQFVVIKDCTEIIAFHEMAHLKHFEQVGDAYFGLNKLEKEMFVWEQILANKNRWTQAELADSLMYINWIREELYSLKPLKIK